MRTLVIVHQFPPKESAGTEVYAYKLAKGLQERGHDVWVYYTQRYPDRAQYELTRGSYDGLPVFEVVNNHEFGTFRGVYKDERMEEHLRAILDEIRPEVVHVQHLHLHSIDYVSIIKERGIPVMWTLAEYLNICPRNGWLAKLDFTLCEGPEPDECATCAAGLWPPPWGWEGHPPPLPAEARARRREAPAPAEAPPAPAAVPKAPPASAGRGLHPTHSPYSPPYKRFSLSRFVRKLTGRYRTADSVASAPPPAPAPVPEPAPPAAPAPAPEDAAAAAHAGWVAAVERRWREYKANLDQVDLFVAPSRFLREQFIKTGMIDADRIVYSDYGFDHAPFEDAEALPEREPGVLRLGFIGSIAEQKGVHLIVEAFNGLPEEGVECKVWGGLTGWPDYVELVRGMRRHLGLRFMGPYVNDRIAEVLRAMDALIVPSRWFENSPLTIHEAFMAGIPVLTGDRGGMAELVEDEKSGLHFRMDDAEDLRRQIRRLMDEPELIDRMRGHMPRVKTIAEDAAETEERLRGLLAERSATV